MQGKTIKVRCLKAQNVCFSMPIFCCGYKTKHIFARKTDYVPCL